MKNSFPFKNIYTPVPLSKATLEELRSLVIFHPNLNIILDEILTFVELGSSEKILLVVGPTGVGKSTLIQFIYSKLLNEFHNQGKQSPVRLSILPPEGSTFGFRTFYIQLMEALDEPLPNYKAEPEFRRAQIRRKPGLKKNRSTGECRLDVDTLLVNKKCPLILLDEMNHFARSMGKQQMIDHMDVPKSIAGITKTKIVGFGTEGALRLLHLNSELSRRIKPFFFQPYPPEEIDKLFSCYVSICKDLKLNTTVGKEHKKYLHTNSVGLIGQLSSWMSDAIIHALRRRSKTLDIEDLKAEQPSIITTKSIQRDLLLFKNASEKILAAIDNEIEGELKKVGFKTPGKRGLNSRDSTGGIL